jgi:sialate O-acetylesterase
LYLLKNNFSSLILIFFFLIGLGNLHAQIKLPRLVSDGAVLQRDEEVNLWGSAKASDKLKLTLDGKTYNFQADINGQWKFKLLSHKAGGPFEIVIKGKTDEVKVKDVYFGDVWLGTGQSNMVLNMERIKEKYGDDIVKANYPQIRNFFIKTATNLNGPLTDFSEGKWTAATPEAVLEFGALTYYFARELYDTYKVPIGIINASVGGTPIEAWISENGFKDFDEIKKTISKNKEKIYVEDRIKQVQNNVALTLPGIDQGMSESPKWFEQSFQLKGWANINIPGYWEDQGLKDLDGIVWYRREIEVTKSMCDTDAKLFLGRIIDSDIVYVNGTQVGNVTYQYPPRRYNIAKGILKPGKNTIVIKVQNNAGKGGFVPDKPYYLSANNEVLDLKGTWQYKVGQVNEPTPQSIVAKNSSPLVFQNQPTALFNAMTAPIVSQTKIKGVLWYQGESNASNPQSYRSYLEAMIKDYRQLFANQNLPFYTVQLANYMDQDLLPTESNWAFLRYQQFLASKLPNASSVVTTDLGEWNDIHPLNKKDIGLRLAATAKNVVYGDKTMLFSGPSYKGFKIVDDKVIVSFDHLGSGLKSSDGEPLKYFAIAGEDKKYVWADATIVNNEVVLKSPKVPRPSYVRYAWANNPIGANLTNNTGIPASCFEDGDDRSRQLWHGKKAAVVLTYDDALEVHVKNVLPELNKHGFKGTFYLTASFPGSTEYIADWKLAAQQGHELGNHTIYHPCDASKPGRSWVAPSNDLHNYTTAEIVREIKMTNTFLESLDGKKERTFAYTCGDTHTKEGSFVEAIKNQFVALRGVNGEVNKQGNYDIQNVNCYVMSDDNMDQLQGWAEKARNENAMLVVLFHGVGGGHGINVDLKKHHAFLQYLKDNDQDYWVTTMIDAAKNSMSSK